MLILSLLICLLAGCGETGNHGETGNSGEDITSNEIIQNGDNGGNTDTPSTNAAPADVDFSQADGDMFTDRDARTEYDESDGVLIQLNGTSAAASSNSVKISGTTITITEEATYILSGTLDDGMIIVNAPDTAKLQIVLNGAQAKSYSSGNKAVATVSKAGLVTAKLAGKAKITVKLTDGKKLTLTVKVTDPKAPKTVKITQGKNAALKAGKTLALKTTLTPKDARYALTWTSSNKKVATVSSKGVVKAKKAGKAKITVTTQNGKKASLTITVK